MGTQDVPQWLISAFARSCRAAGATADRAALEATARRLLDRWSTGERHHHTVRHLVDVLARVEELAGETHHPDLVRLAAWYHGAVFSTVALKAYQRAAGEDKEASAQLAIEQLGELGVPAEVTERVADLILHLKRHDAPKDDIDAQALSDADLGTIAVDPQKFRSYREAVRKEFAHIPLRHYIEARIRVIDRLLDRKRIFTSPLARDWDDQARQNLGAELARLTAELEQMGECAVGDHLPEPPEDAAADDGPGPAGRARQERSAAVQRRSLRHRAPAGDRDLRTATEVSTTSTMARVRPAAPLPMPAPGRPDEPADRGDRPADDEHRDAPPPPPHPVWSAVEQARPEPRQSGLESEPEEPRRRPEHTRIASPAASHRSSPDHVTRASVDSVDANQPDEHRPPPGARSPEPRSPRDTVPTMVPPDAEGDPVPRHRRIDTPPDPFPDHSHLPEPVPADPGPDLAEPHEAMDDDEQEMPSLAHPEPDEAPDRAEDRSDSGTLSAMEREPDLFTRRDRRR